MEALIQTGEQFPESTLVLRLGLSDSLKATPALAQTIPTSVNCQFPRASTTLLNATFSDLSLSQG